LYRGIKFVTDKQNWLEIALAQTIFMPLLERDDSLFGYQSYSGSEQRRIVGDFGLSSLSPSSLPAGSYAEARLQSNSKFKSH
jgi:hypothetical protein